jgi:hypothetical protein
MKDFAKHYLSFVSTSIVNPGEIIYSCEGALGFGDFSGIIIRNLSGFPSIINHHPVDLCIPGY